MALGEEQKRFIVAEIKRQIEPTHSLLKDLKKQGNDTHEWLLGFWSNGSGRPEGLFQRRMKDDDKWRAGMDAHKEKVTELIEDLRKAREFRELREQEAKERHKRYWALAWKIGTPILGAILTAAGWGIAKVTPVIRMLVDDYLKAHPYVSEQLKNRSSVEHDPAYADNIQDSQRQLDYHPEVTK